MAILTITVPHETARVLRELDVPGERQDSGDQHITIFYFGDNVPVARLAKIMESTYKVTEKAAPFTLTLKEISTFPPHPKKGSVPIICPIESSELHALRDKLKDTFDKDGVEYDDTFPEFKPHTTLSYLYDKPNGSDYKQKLSPPLQWGAHQITLWGGDEGDTKLSVTFPLSLKKSSARVATRYRMASMLRRYTASR